MDITKPKFQFPYGDFELKDITLVILLVPGWRNVVLYGVWIPPPSIDAPMQ